MIYPASNILVEAKPETLPPFHLRWLPAPPITNPVFNSTIWLQQCLSTLSGFHTRLFSRPQPHALLPRLCCSSCTGAFAREVGRQHHHVFAMAVLFQLLPYTVLKNSHMHGPVKPKVKTSGLPPPETTIPWKSDALSGSPKRATKCSLG